MKELGGHPQTPALAKGWPAAPWALGGLVVLAAVVAFPLLVRDPFPQHLLTLVFMYAALGVAWNLLGGYAGQISLGHALFFAAGAYSTTLLVDKLDLTPWLGMLVGVLVAVALALAIGWPCFRLSGHYFAIATIAVVEIAAIIFTNWQLVGGASGLRQPILPEGLVNFQFHGSKAPYYYVALVLLALSLAVTLWAERSRVGYYLRAIREDQTAARALGVPVVRYKQIAIALSAALTALAGSFYAQLVLFVDPESVLSTRVSVLIALIAIVGGTGRAWGPVLGAVLLVPLAELTRVYLSGGGRALDLLVYGALIMAFAVFEPRGLAGLLGRLRH